MTMPIPEAIHKYEGQRSLQLTGMLVLAINVVELCHNTQNNILKVAYDDQQFHL